jgi:glutamate-ammonia-ligase adenylyltransferase
MFRSRLTRHPNPFDPEAGRCAVEAAAPPPEAVDLVRGAAGGSPFLARLIEREREWLAACWEEEPETALEDLVARVAALDGDPSAPLREAKRRAALLVALCDLGGVWSTMEATAALTRFADAALAAALRLALGGARAPVEGDGGLAAIAMGKMGAFELNYSSDIDLILVFDQDRYEPPDYAPARQQLIHAARRAADWLSKVTPEGYVFRTDLRLRPDPASTPIVLSMAQAERYYEALGRTWERAAHVKARAAAGALAAGEAYLGRLDPFVWRRHLDFAAVQDAHDIRLGIRAHKGRPGPWDVPGHDVKIGQGGIREIEFFTQTRQIIAGGRDPSLRVRGTLDGLDRLAASGWVERDVAARLSRRYLFLRDVEHRLQMVQDVQTQTLPSDAEGMRRIACLMGRSDPDAFREELRAAFSEVEGLVGPFFRPATPAAPAEAPESGRGFSEAALERVDRWTLLPALRSERARIIFARLRPGLLEALARAAEPDEALVAFDGFLSGLPAGVQLLSLFEANPQLVGLLADICALAPDLARHLAANAEVLDAVIAGGFMAPLPEFYDASACVGEEFETSLDALRRWHREAHFRIGVHLLRGLLSRAEAALQHSFLAEGTTRACWLAARRETGRRYGPLDDLRLAGLGMGSLGARQLTARSDLDLVVLFDGAESAESRRGLGPRQWAARFTQTLITALSAPTGEGRLYEVDMRLRPSGRQGPVAVSLAGFRRYQAEEAWAWEHMALTRARVVAGDGGLGDEVEAARREVIAAGRYAAPAVATQLADMRRRLAEAGRKGAGLAVKSGPGRMQDVELAAQAHALVAGCPRRATAEQLAAPGWLPPLAREALARAHALMADVTQLTRLLTREDPPGALGTGGDALLAARTGTADRTSLEREIDERAAEAADAIDAALR